MTKLKNHQIPAATPFKKLFKTQNINAVKTVPAQRKPKKVLLTETAPKLTQKVLKNMTKMVMEQFNGHTIRERHKQFQVHPSDTNILYTKTLKKS